jgi:hypothetical protein
MSPHFPVFSLLLFLVTATAVAEERSTVRVRYSDLGSSTPVIGVLGVPLGTVVEVEAEIVAEPEPHVPPEAHLWRFFLRIHKVNGEDAQDCTPISFSTYGLVGWSEDPAPLSLMSFEMTRKRDRQTAEEREAIRVRFVGRKYRLFVYETGGFYGLPVESTPMHIEDGSGERFRFQPRLSVLFERGSHSDKGQTVEEWGRDGYSEEEENEEPNQALQTTPMTRSEI